MLRYALRRTLWAIPTLFGVSLLVFFVTTLIPDPAGETRASYVAVYGAVAKVDPSGLDAMEGRRRAHFLDLPRFFNPRPMDVRLRAEEAVAHLAAKDDDAPLFAYRLARLGGAALPYVVPQLDNLPPAARGRVAVALAPIARRMGFHDLQLEDPERAALFWVRLWEDRSLDFTQPAVRRAVHRLILHGTDLREKELLEVDTFALDEIVLGMAVAADREALARLASAASHVTGRSVEIPVDADPGFARRAVADWQEWWYVHRSDYVAFNGVDRFAATISETRYGKWVLRAASGELGISTRDGEPVLDKLRARAPLTLALTALAMLISYAIAVPIGVFSAWRRGHAIDRVLAILLFALYSLPTFWAAELLARTSAAGSTHLFLPVTALMIGSLASLSRYQRASMLDVVRQDYIRTARAKGLSLFRVLVVHALRNALIPTVTLAGLQLPALFGGAFIVEEVFGLPGLGYETLRAVEAHDSPWLTATILLLAVVTTLGLILSDVAYGALDPRVRETLLDRASSHAS
jgi:ABC-type dipeptide/oligopeptide/nickel transport system permease component